MRLTGLKPELRISRRHMDDRTKELAERNFRDNDTSSNYDRKQEIIKALPAFEEAMRDNLEDTIMGFTGEVATGESDGEWDYTYNKFIAMAISILASKIR